MGEQRTQAGAPHAGDAAILAPPEITVMHENRIRLALNRRLDQRLARGDATHHTLHLNASFHLQTVWAIIFHPRGGEQLFEVGLQLCAQHVRFPHSWLKVEG